MLPPPRPLAALPEQPWRNGGGLTRPLAAAGPDHAPRWRLSVATITGDGPFSLFPGLQRHAALLDGPGLRLEGARDADTPLDFPQPGCVQVFDGARALQARLGAGPARLCNLMVQPEAVLARLIAAEAANPGPPLLAPPCGREPLLALIVRQGSLQVQALDAAGRQAQALSLNAGELLLWTAPVPGLAALRLQAEAPDSAWLLARAEARAD